MTPCQGCGAEVHRRIRCRHAACGAMVCEHCLHGDHQNHPAIVKRCGCNRVWTLAGWLTLPLVGRQDDEVEKLELRTCRCGSTLAVVMLSEDAAGCFYQVEGISA
jgi:hypothetical protein